VLTRVLAGWAQEDPGRYAALLCGALGVASAGVASAGERKRGRAAAAGPAAASKKHQQAKEAKGSAAPPAPAQALLAAARQADQTLRAAARGLEASCFQAAADAAATAVTLARSLEGTPDSTASSLLLRVLSRLGGVAALHEGTPLAASVLLLRHTARTRCPSLAALPGATGTDAAAMLGRGGRGMRHLASLLAAEEHSQPSAAPELCDLPLLRAALFECAAVGRGEPEAAVGGAAATVCPFLDVLLLARRGAQALRAAAMPAQASAFLLSVAARHAAPSALLHALPGGLASGGALSSLSTELLCASPADFQAALAAWHANRREGEASPERAGDLDDAHLYFFDTAGGDRDALRPLQDAEEEEEEEEGDAGDLDKWMTDSSRAVKPKARKRTSAHGRNIMPRPETSSASEEDQQEQEP